MMSNNTYRAPAAAWAAYFALLTKSLKTITLHHCAGCGRYHVWQFDGGCPAGERGYASAAEYESHHDTTGYRVVLSAA